jgi:hypothetical protein
VPEAAARVVDGAGARAAVEYALYTTRGARCIAAAAGRRRQRRLVATISPAWTFSEQRLI